MIKHLLNLFVLVILSKTSVAQPLYQYFEGADTSSSNSVLYYIDTTGGNTWQVGPPQKNIFNVAASVPNVLVTDTINPYPVNDSSVVTFEMIPPWWGPFIYAFQWNQKLDLTPGLDGGVVEFSADNGATWQNAFNNPYVYNFYGFDADNKDTLPSGEYVFSGVDSTWKNIWLCLDPSFFMSIDTVMFRFTLKSDSSFDNREGWMVDNIIAHYTMIHTVDEKQANYLNVYPTPTTGIVYIETEKRLDYHIIEHMELLDATGKIVQTFGMAPTKFFIDIGNHTDGQYFLRVTTNVKTETVPVILKR